MYCCEQNAGEPLGGTADRVDVWILLEYRPAWKARAVEDNELPQAARRWLDDGLAALSDAGLKGRVALVRRREAGDAGLHLFVAAAGALRMFSGADYGFLESVRLPAVVEGTGGGELLTAPHYFVCTNGQRDSCCGRFGMPVYRALRERVGERVWQVTHLGGHRFAPNVLVVPQGALYGRVTEAGLEAFLREVEADRLAFPELRGRCRYPAVVQAAEALTGRSDLELIRLEGDDAAARVTFDGAGGPVSVPVRRSDRPLEVQKSCGDAAPATVVPYVPGA